MTKEEREVMRMALEALTIFREWELGQDYNSNRDTVLVRAFKAEEAIEKCLANDALEKKAENARELGLDYEPEKTVCPFCSSEWVTAEQHDRKMDRLEQEPVAWMFQHEETGRMMFVETQQLEWGFEKGNPRLKKIGPLYITPPQPWEKFCDSNCVWTDHHPDCKLAEQEPVATDWERIARVQDAKLRAMCNEAGGFEKLCEVMDKYERTTPPQRKPLTAMEVYDVVHDADLDWHTGFALGEDENRFVVFARAIEAAHGIKGEA